MIENIPYQIFSLAIGTIVFLFGIIWRDFRAQLREVRIEQLNCPFPSIQSDIAAMKKDISWLKQYLLAKKA